MVDFNVTFNAGGRGIHIFWSEYVTVANNSCYNSDLDQSWNGTYRPCIGSELSYGDQFFNNIAVGLPQDAGLFGTGVAPNPGCPSQYGNPPMAGYCLQWNNAYNGGSLTINGVTVAPVDTFTNNVAYCSGPLAAGTYCYQMNNVAAWSNGSVGGVVSTTPWPNVGNSSPGTEYNPPSSSNFAITTGATVNGGIHANYLLPPHDTDLGACYHTLTSCP